MNDGDKRSFLTLVIIIAALFTSFHLGDQPAQALEPSQEEEINFDFDRDFGPYECQFSNLKKLPPKARILAGYTNGRGTRGNRNLELDWPIDNSGVKAKLFKVAVNSPNAPVFLVLTGNNNPALWHVGWTEGTNIVGVYLSGGGTQKIVGLPKTIPIMINTEQNFGACGFRTGKYNSISITPADWIMKRFFSRPVDADYPLVNGHLLIGEYLPEGARLVTMAELRQQDFDPSFKKQPNLDSGRQPEGQQGLLAFDFNVEAVERQPWPTEKCVFPNLPQLPPETKIYAAGTYHGGVSDLHMIDDQNYGVTMVKVGVNSPDAPVLLILGAYDPVIWHIGWTKGTKIAGVLAGGVHRQTVVGLPEDVPTMVRGTTDSWGCGSLYFNGERRFASVPNAVVRYLFNRDIDEVYAANAGPVLAGQALAADQKLVTHDEPRLSSFRGIYKLRSGQIPEENQEEPSNDGQLREIPFEMPKKSNDPGEMKLRGLELPPKTKFYAVGDSGPKELLKVAVNSPGEPVVLVLRDYHPHTWHIGWTRDTKIVAVLASGYYEQKIIGLPDKVPVVNPFYIPSETGVSFLEQADKAIERIFGRHIDRYYKMIKGQALVGRDLPDDVELMTYLPHTGSVESEN